MNLRRMLYPYGSVFRKYAYTIELFMIKALRGRSLQPKGAIKTYRWIQG